MKILFDNNILYRIVKKLIEQFPDSLHVSRMGLSVPVADYAIWQFAKKESYMIVTFDEDFETFANLYGFPPKVILMRLGNSSTNHITNTLKSKIVEIENFYASPSYGLLEIY